MTRVVLTGDADDRVVLKTARLSLRHYHRSDIETLVALLNNWDVARRLASLPHPYCQSDAEGFLERLEEGDPKVGLALAIAWNGSLIGGIALSPRSGGVPVLGYWLGEPYWGSGFMSEAVGALVSGVAAHGSPKAIDSGAFADNAASLRILEKTGFKVTGQSLKQCVARRGAFPHIDMRFSLEKDHAAAP